MKSNQSNRANIYINKKELLANTVFVQDCIYGKVSQLYQLDLNTGQTSLVGLITTDVYDLAMVDSQLYGIHQPQNQTSQLLKIDYATGKTTTVGDIGFKVVGLAYHRGRDTLYATAAKQLIKIDRQTGRGKPALTVSQSDRSCGEIAFAADGSAYITLIGVDRKKLLVSCDLDSGKTDVIGDIGFSDLASMEFIDDVLYGVTGNFFDLGKDGQLIRINTQTGKGTLVTRTKPRGRWAGITVYQPAQLTTDSAKLNFDQQSIVEENMILTINTKDNCYVINADGMSDLQENVASRLTLDQGSYEIKINSGSYSYANSKGGEPFVLLWIYGVDGSTFVNQNTRYETGATWTTLNGSGDRLRLEVKNQAVVCGLFFDVNRNNNSGSVELIVNSNRENYQPQKLTVDAKKNCYVLDQKYLSSLKQDRNSIELEPGNYRIKIQSGDATYWSNEQKFQLEPWALIHLQSGKFISGLTGVEVEQSWCSLNGLQDELMLEVKSKTTVSGLFFDTYKEDNQGQIILEIEPVTVEEIAGKYQQQSIDNQQSAVTASIDGSKQAVEAGSRDYATTAQVSGQTTTVNANQTAKNSFSFHFDTEQIEQMWQQMAAKIETSVTVTDEQDEKREAYYWDNLEKWILKGYQTQAKDLAMQVARVEFMMKSITQQMEVSFNQNFQAWSSYFDSRLNELIDTRMTGMVEEQVNLKLGDRVTDIKNQVVHQLQQDIDSRVESAVNLKISDRSQTIKNQVVEQLQQDIDQRIESVVNLKVENQAQTINNLVVEQLQDEMDSRINNVVNVKVENQSQEINNQVVQQLQENMDQRIDATVNLKMDDQTQNVKNLVLQQLQADVDQRIDSVVNLKLSDRTPEISNSIVQQLQADMDKRIEAAVGLKIDNQTSNVKNLVLKQMQTDLDTRIDSVVNQKTDNSVQLVVNNVINNVDDRIDVKLENKILNFRDDVTSIVKNELNQNYTNSIKSTVLSDIKKQQFFMDMQTIKAEVNNFYSRLGQFETQLYLRIEQGDTQLYNWTLEQLTALQGCLSDRQTLANMFESFASSLKNELDNAPCVQPTRFTPWVRTETQPQIKPMQPAQLPEKQS